MAGEQYEALFEEKGKQHNVDPALLRVIAHQESRFNPKAVSPQGALGLMQIMPATARGLKVNPKNEAEAIDGAARLLAEALDRNNGNLEDAIGEYHGGPDRKIWGPKNRQYRKEVMAKYRGEQAPADGVDDILFGDTAKPTDTAQATPGAADGILFGDVPPKAQMTSGPTIDAKNGEITFGDSGAPVSAFQKQVITTLAKANKFDPDAPEGSLGRPWVQRNPEDKFGPGEYYIPVEKAAGASPIQRTPGGEDETGAGEKVGRGLMRGFGDVALSAFNMMPGSEDSSIRQHLAANQILYDADLKGDPVAGGARFTGQALTAGGTLGAGEAVAAKALGGSALGKFVTGNAGRVMAPSAARLATRGASLAMEGAILGGGGAALTSSASDEPVSDQVKTGMIAGGILGPLAPAVVGAGNKAAGWVKNAAGRWTYEGREKAIDRLLGEVAPKGFNLDTREIVPGSIPTMAEAAGESGIAALERNARTNPKLAQVFQERLDQNAAARTAFFEKVAKDPEAIVDAEAAREAATTKLRETAFKGAKEADADPVIAKIAEILAGPSGQRDAVVAALQGLPAKLKQQTDVEQLYGIRKDIGDMLDPRASSEKKGARLAASELMAVKGEIDKAIERAAPGFKDYLKTYSEMSKPIDEMKLLQGLKLTDQRGNITLAKVNSAIDKIETKRKAGGTSKEKSVSEDTLAALHALREDLDRAANIMKGKAAGSDTSQNIVMNQFAEGGGVPLGVSAAVNAKLPGASIILGAADKAVSNQNEKMLQQLSSRLLQPKPVKPRAVKPVKRPGTIGRGAIPGLGGVAASRLLSE